MPTIRLLALTAMTLGAPLPAAMGADGDAERHFSQRVQPLLVSRCIACHGSEEQEGGLRLDSREAVLRGGKRGPAVVAEQPDQSLLMAAVRHDEPKYAMPPKEKLSGAEIAALEQWIRQGVPWSKGGTAPLAAPSEPGERIGNAWEDPRNPIVRIFQGERLDLWSLRPIERPELPASGAQAATARNGIDALLPAPPAAQADRRTLARRLSFSLTGLPPTADEVGRFQNDDRPDAYERLADQLLASPRFGEHQARSWLDLVRYSDSNGFDWDEYRPQAWRYRDYVIRSLNADKPFDQFVAEQLAGDELVSGAPQTLAEQDALVATGYLRVGPQDNSSALFNEQARSRAEWMSDLVETTGTAFLGLTLNCCRCHDHKHDPISHADYYRFRALFEPLQRADELPLDLAQEQEAIRQHNEALDARIGPLQNERAALLAAAKQRLPAEVQAKAKEADVRMAFTDDEKKQDESLASQIKSIDSERRRFLYGLVATDSREEVPATKVLYQGDYKAEREEVAPGFLSVLDPNAALISPAPNSSTKGRRLALARWITSPDNPLASRVLANRLWQAHWGEGIVSTPGDFGLAGAAPTNLALLDWLACEARERNWSLKTMHRRLVSSGAYRQPRAPSRLAAEQLRDALLAASGLLTAKAGGPPVWPSLPADVLQANPAFLDDNETKTKGWYPSPPHEQHARSIFQVQKRTVKVPFLETFDLPENMVACARRNVSTVPSQALSLLNSPLAIEAAQALAERARAEAGTTPEAQVESVFLLALQRRPSEEEHQACQQLIREQGLVQLCRVVLNLNEFAYLD